MRYKPSDQERAAKEKISDLSNEEYREEFRRDYARLIHSPSFRRLQGKTQLYPGRESDFFRNRLTHSLEVAQIAKSIAIRLNSEISNNENQISLDICEVAGLAHDIGHPPFGHQGEEALDECMRDFGGFEGNAQTLRILTRLEKKALFDVSEGYSYDNRAGLNLTFRSLASVLKYDRVIPEKNDNRTSEWINHPMKGYYNSESDIVSQIKEKVISSDVEGFKTIECSIMDLADDIAYSTYDIEDAFKAGFLNPLKILYTSDEILEQIIEKIDPDEDKGIEVNDIKEVLYRVFGSVFDVEKSIEDFKSPEEYAYYYSNTAYNTSIESASNGYLRNIITSGRIGYLIRGAYIDNDDYTPLAKVSIDEERRLEIDVLKYLVYCTQVENPKLSIAKHRGQDIVKEIFGFLYSKGGYDSLPDDFRAMYDEIQSNDLQRARVICDFIAGMTDRYCSEFYYRLKSENPKSIFVPL